MRTVDHTQLSEWAEVNEIRCRTAYNWSRSGVLLVPAPISVTLLATDTRVLSALHKRAHQAKAWRWRRQGALRKG